MQPTSRVGLVVKAVRTNLFGPLKRRKGFVNTSLVVRVLFEQGSYIAMKYPIATAPAYVKLMGEGKYSLKNPTAHAELDAFFIYGLSFHKMTCNVKEMQLPENPVLELLILENPTFESET